MIRTLRCVAPEAAIEVRELRKSFGDVKALCGIDLSAPPGTILGLLGPNGAGKTTAVRILTTLLPPDSGIARVAGLDVVKDAARLRSEIGLAGQYAAVDENLTGFENLEMVGRLYHLGRGPSKDRARGGRGGRPSRGFRRRPPCPRPAGARRPAQPWPRTAPDRAARRPARPRRRRGPAARAARGSTRPATRPGSGAGARRRGGSWRCRAAPRRRNRPG